MKLYWESYRKLLRALVMFTSNILKPTDGCNQLQTCQNGQMLRHHSKTVYDTTSKVWEASNDKLQWCAVYMYVSKSLILHLMISLSHCRQWLEFMNSFFVSTKKCSDVTFKLMFTSSFKSF